MKLTHIGLLCCAWLAAGAAQAGITQAPTLPAQVNFKLTAADETGEPLLVPVATGSATLLNGRWVADVADVSPTLIHLAGDAGIQFASSDPSVPLGLDWKNISIDLTTQRVNGDGYLNGVLTSPGHLLFFTIGFDGGPDVMPEGKATLWADGAALCELYKPCTHVAMWDPIELGTASIRSSVPEPDTAASTLLGLLAVTWVLRTKRRAS